MKTTIIVGTILAFLAGALAWVLPPHLLGRIAVHYPPNSWTWIGDGIWNAQPLVSIPLIVIIGFLYGMFIPRFWYLSLPAVWWIVLFNVIQDGFEIPTSHNLWPFEVLIFA